MTFSQFFIIFVLLIIGIFVFFKPIISKAQSGYKGIADSSDFDDLQEQKEQAKAESEETGEEDSFTKLKNGLQEYNEEIFKNYQKDLTGDLPKPKDEIEFDTSLFDIDINIFGYVTVERVKKKRKNKEPKIYSMQFPIYLKATKSNLIKGFFPLPQTSMPIGGENTFSILYGYPKNGIGKDNKFKLRIGDTITIQNVWGTLKYQVTNLCCLTKDDTEYMKIQDGEDEVALLISEPHNSKRYCAYAKRYISETD